MAILRCARSFATVLASFVCCASPKAATHGQTTLQPTVSACDLATAGVWVRRWVAAWDLTSRQILRLPDAPTPNLVFYDSSCVYTTSRVTAGVAPTVRGTAIPGTKLPWWSARHNGTLTLPDSKKVPLQLMSFAASDQRTGPFFVMAAPDYWRQAGHGQEPGLTAVFLHEFSHTRQTAGMAAMLGPIDSAWKFPQPLDDDIVQTRFAADSAYRATFVAERDLLYRAAIADSVKDVRALAKQALDMIRARHARWFVGDNAVFATLDAIWLSMEGAGQWAAYGWLVNQAGGGVDRPTAVKTMIGQRRSWSQDEGLGLFLVVDRLLPEWPSLVFGNPSIGAVELLERAIQR